MRIEDSCIYNYIKPFIGNLEQTNYKKGQYILFSDEDFEEIFFILEGCVKVECSTQNGKKFLVDTLEENEFVGKISYIFEEDLCSDIIALTDVKLISIEKKIFDELKKDSNFTNMFFSKTSKRIYYIYKKLLVKDLFKLEEILAYHIIKNSQGNIFKFKSMYQLSNELTVSRKNLYNTINKFILKGYIKKSNNEILIIEEDSLKMVAKNVDQFY